MEGDLYLSTKRKTGKAGTAGYAGATQTKIEELYERHKEHLLPARQVREIVDREMGGARLTDELYATREGR